MDFHELGTQKVEKYITFYVKIAMLFIAVIDLDEFVCGLREFYGISGGGFS